jgi:hypothetical protein
MVSVLPSKTVGPNPNRVKPKTMKFLLVASPLRNDISEGIYYDAISAVGHHGNNSEWKEANVTLIGNNSYENVKH